MPSRILIPSDLLRLRQGFQSIDRDVRFVGGCVRDTLFGLVPKDIDLCTDASINEMILIASRLGITVIPTGAEHGTLTFKLDSGLYEITCLREETKHDGRRAECRFGRDWDKDLSRRDLTINAMAMDFDGVIYDPFGGQKDLEHGIVRFVGEAADRMREDYLRILRWLRFHGRYRGAPIDFHAMLAAQDVREGLSKRDVDGSFLISRERVWAEMAKIFAGPSVGYILHYLVYMRLDEHIDMKGPYNVNRLEWVAKKTDDYIVRLVAFMTSVAQVEALAEAWKWSVDERKRAVFLAKEAYGRRTRLDWLVLMGMASKEWAEDIALIREDEETFETLRAWNPPSFPLRGQDLLDIGFTPGPAIGYHLDELRVAWAHADGLLTKEQLLQGVTPETNYG
ncbi:tRNA nucleotidyltransferase [Caulobacter phage CcrBL9]|uniref:tRNA nucleotidyltransferase n=1 Tax=Caulobacter phage CcrBL9 TaxID=2283270 RepID=A0A385EBR5_9CAUD|nr:tRNA nucleotidyltransferase [Caulobacter phage CcrBL9]AXQ69331.1 tRNA nucleotidyltransferase [Caulobacter phage CcrBL9]